MRLENLDKNVEEGYKVLPNIDKERYTEMPGLEGPFQTMSGKPIYYDPKEGAYYDRDTDMYLTYDEFKALDEAMTDKEENDFHNALDKVVHKHIGHSSDEDEEKERLTKKVKEGKMSPKEELKMLKANVKNPGQSDKAKEKMKARIKELEAMLEEGDYPSKLAKGHKNYKAQQAAVAISKRESKINKVSINQVCEAVKQNDPTIAVAQYVSCLLYTSPSPRDRTRSRMPSSA